MQLLKPVWVSHDGRPIFSVDIHPDGSRFATGGQGDETGSGKVIIWNMSPVRNEGDEKDDAIPKILCQMDNHIACVNCVRWSRNGKYLASCGDDKVGIIWQTSRYQGPSTVFGSNGKVVNVEQWRPVSTLRGHIGDILDLSWSPNDIWLATSSIDNTVIVWNALRFPEQVAILKGHTGLVKGVTWDPVGKYLASQSDDRSLKIWRTLDWQQEASITEPFKECGGTTHVLRLSWSPDGHYIVSAHAMNNSGPTAQIIEREGWKATLDFVGHRKAITVVRFNPNILSKKIKKGDEKAKQYCCCAIGSRDHSLSIWLTALKRPLVVTHDLFTNSILDISWSKDGMELLCCSGDGTVAYVCFAREEIGVPLLDTEIQTVLENTYGKNLPLTNQGNQVSQVIESADMLNLQQEKKKETERLKIESPCKYSNSSSMNGELLLKPRDKQIETRTADGRRRITPIFIAPQPDIGDAPLPFDSKRVLSSSTKEPSRIVVEKQDRVTGPGVGSSSSPSITPNTSPQAAKPSSAESTPKSCTLTPKKLEPTLKGECATFQPMAALEKSQVTKPAQQVPKETSQKETSSGKTSDKESVKKEDQYKDIRNNLSIKRKLDEKGRVKTVKLKKPKDDNKPIPSLAAAPLNSHTFERDVVPHSVSDLVLPAPHIDKLHSKQIYGKLGTENSVVLEVENNIRVGINILHKLQSRKGGSLLWDQVLSSKAIAVAGSNHIACAACEDQSLCIYSSSGRKLFPNMVLNSQISTLKCTGYYVMAITQKGHLFVWNMKKHTAVIKNEPLYSILSGSEKIQKTSVTSEGVPIITLSTNISYTFSTDLGCWVILSNKNDPLQRCSDHNKYIPADPLLRSQGTLQSLLSSNDQLGITAGKMLHGGVNMQHSATLVNIENHLAASHTLKSGTDYKFWLHTYIRFLVQEGVEQRLREICDELLGPVYKSKSQSWQQYILGFDKRDLLREVLPLIGQNLRFQRLYTEYQDQLESLSK